MTSPMRQDSRAEPAARELPSELPAAIEAWEDALGELGRRISAAVDPPAGRDPGAIVRPRVPVPDVSPLSWLRGRRGSPRVFWSGRAPDEDRAGAGIADTRSASRPGEDGAAFDAVRGRLEASPAGARYFGGMRFDPARAASEAWAPFGTLWLALPRFELIRSGGRSELVCNVIPARDRRGLEAILEDLAAMTFPEPGPAPEPGSSRAVRRTDLPARGAWDAVVDRALAAIADGRLDKVVLARETCLHLAGSLDPVDLLEGLRASAVASCSFLVEPAAEAPAFVGVSPERLYLREGRRLTSDSIAGTRPRGESGARDRALARELLDSEKERREHRFVADAIREALETLCGDVRGDGQPSILKLATLQHVVSRFEGTIADGVDDRTILERLHPTPAVGGVPRERALEMLREAEPFDRGWYSGPVGWIGADGAEFAVAIRSALVQGETLRLFSGAGIVRGSTPAREWDELESKIGGLLETLG